MGEILQFNPNIRVVEDTMSEDDILRRYPMYCSAIRGLKKGIRLLDMDIRLPRDIEKKILGIDYTLREDSINLEELGGWNRTFLTLCVFQEMHEEWGNRNINDMLISYYGKEGRFFPFLMSGEFGFRRFLGGNVPLLLKKLTLDSGLVVENDYIDFPEGMAMFMLFRNIFCEERKLRNAEDLARFVRGYAIEHYMCIAPKIALKIERDDSIVERIVKNLISRNIDKF